MISWERSSEEQTVLREKKMNLPNRLTLLRVLMVPFFVWFLLAGWGMRGDIAALAVFAAASFTDYLDGHLARKYHLITNFGKFMDPLADKLLVGSAVICLVALGRLPAAACVVLIGREFVISGFRLIAAEQGLVIAAGIWGKVKTVCQMIMTMFLILHLDYSVWRTAELILIIASVALALISLADYLWTNRAVLKDMKTA